ncbi:MFS transporter [Candidatus Altiarchaeota archaeon]
MFEVKESLSGDDVKEGMRFVFRDGLTTQAMVTLTGGVFLVAFALKLGASNTVIGLLAAIPPLLTLAQIPSIYIVEKYRVRKAVVVAAAAISRISLLIMVLIPFVMPPGKGLIALLLALMIHSGFAAIGGAGWNPWMMDLIPKKSLGTFFSRRLAYSLTLGIALSIIAGYFIDWWELTRTDAPLHGFSILFIFGFIAGIIGVYFISRIPEPRMRRSGMKMDFFSLLIKPFSNLNFRNLILFTGSWSFAVNLAAPFFTVYMLQRLDFDMSYVIGLMVLSQIFNVGFLQIWGRFTDKYSNKSVLSVSGPLFMMCILAWTFTTLPEKHSLTIPLLIVIHVFMGISTAGVTIATGNIGLKLAPEGEATSYLASSSAINSVIAGIAPIIGGGFADYFSKRQLSVTLNYLSPNREIVLQTLNFQQWDFFFALAFLIGVYSFHRLALVKEEGDVEKGIVLQELLAEVKRETRNLSTASGMRNMLFLPVMMMKKTIRKK